MSSALRHAVGLACLTAASAAGSKLAPALSYAGKDSVHSFLHSYDSLPKVLLLRDKAPAEEPKGEEQDKPEQPEKKSTNEKEAPSWFTSVAVHFKDGRKKSASFAHLLGEDAKKVAARFGVQGELPPSGVLIGCVVDGKSSGSYAVYDGYLGESSGNVVREARAFVQSLVDGPVEGQPLPAFPPPDVPRKSAAVSLVELTHENVPTHCFGGPKSLCVIALLPCGANGCPDAFKALAARHRNDPVQFAWLDTRGQAEFIAAFGVEASSLPVLVAVRSGKRSRYTLLASSTQTDSMNAFVDTILGGGATFTRISELPELTPPYLMEPEDKEEL